ncbi:hypothetical protein AB5N19_09801 [Seiridium cardinale]
MNSFLDELEYMAQGAATGYQDAAGESEMVGRWQRVFGYTSSEAINKIEQHRNDLNRATITLEQWNMVRAEREAEGHDKDSYEHSINVSKHARISLPTPAPAKRSKKKSAMFLLKLEGPLRDVKTDQQAARLAHIPELLVGSDDFDGESHFCKIDSLARDNILEFIRRQAPSFEPTTIRHSVADKDLCPISAHPTLGIEATLPQFRHEDNVVPRNDEYPVWYFFYGTLADPEVLERLIGAQNPHLVSAQIRGGILKTWGGKYKALVDQTAGKMEEVISGHAFLVKTQEQEAALRAYETDNYEVVCCGIEMDEGRYVRGLTFRFVGEVD